MPSNEDFYRSFHFLAADSKQTEVDEGIDVLVVSSYREPDRLSMVLSGLSHGGRPGPHLIAQAVEAALFVDSENIEVLIIGFGTGSFVETFVAMDEVTSVICVEISQTVIDNSEPVNDFETLATKV